MKLIITNKSRIALTIIIAVLFVFTVVVLSYQKVHKTEGELNIYNWKNYVAPMAIEGFEQKYGIRINQYYFDNQSDLLDEFKTGKIADKYDLVFFGDEFAEELVGGGYLLPLDLKNVPNSKYINKRFMDSKLNADKTYVISYNWGTTGLLINKNYIPQEDWHWSSLFDEKYKDKSCMLRDSAEVIGSAAIYLGLKLVPQTTADMKKVGEVLMERKKGKNNYCGDFEIAEKMLNGDIWLAQYWNGWAYDFVVSRDNKDFQYVIPEEGGGVWSDMMAIPKDAKNIRAAEMFMNYINQPKVAAENVSYLKYASTNEEAKKYIDKDILDNEIIYPNDVLIGENNFFVNFTIDETIIKMRDELWKELNK